MGMGGVGNMRGGMPMGNMGMGMGMGMNNAAMGGGGMQGKPDLPTVRRLLNVHCAGGFAPNMGGQAGYWNPNFNFNGGGATGSSPIGGQNPHGNKRPKME